MKKKCLQRGELAEKAELCWNCSRQVIVGKRTLTKEGSMKLHRVGKKEKIKQEMQKKEEFTAR